MEAKQEYREAVMEICRSGYTVISPVDREALELILKRTGLLLRDAVAIEDEVISAFRRYERELVEQGLKQYPLNNYAKEQLAKLQEVLNLTDTDISELNTYVFNFLASQKKINYIGYSGCFTVLLGIGALSLLLLILMSSSDSRILIAILFFIVPLVIFLGFILSFVGSNATYDSYMVMRYGNTWRS